MTRARAGQIWNQLGCEVEVVENGALGVECCMEAGMSGHLGKPFNLRMLSESLAKWGEFGKPDEPSS